MNKKQLFEDFISENLNKIYRFAYSYTINHQDAEDVVHESVVKAIKSIDSLNKMEFLSTWFYRIVINTAIGKLKQSKKVVYIDSDKIEDESVTDGGISRIGELTFEDMIRSLEPKYKSIVVLKYFEERTFEEIAEIMQENVNTVKTRLYKALKVLRVEMEESI